MIYGHKMYRCITVINANISYILSTNHNCFCLVLCIQKMMWPRRKVERHLREMYSLAFKEQFSRRLHISDWHTIHRPFCSCNAGRHSHNPHFLHLQCCLAPPDKSPCFLLSWIHRRSMSRSLLHQYRSDLSKSPCRSVGSNAQ